MIYDKLIIVSGDGHAEIPHDEWHEYLDPEFRDELRRARTGGEEYGKLVQTFVDFKPAEGVETERVDALLAADPVLSAMAR